MTCGCEGGAALGSLNALDEGWEEKDHVAALIHDRRAAIGAGDFAGKVVRDVFVGRIIPAEIMVPVGEVDVGFVKDYCPLKTRSMQSLASSAMTILRRQRFLPTQLILDLPAMASRIPHRFEVGIVLVDLVRLAVLPLVFFAIGGRSCLVLMLACVSFLFTVVLA
jgi:hypothetical protein